MSLSPMVASSWMWTVVPDQGVCCGAVKYFNNEELERSNFAKAINDYQRVEFQCVCVPARDCA